VSECGINFSIEESTTSLGGGEIDVFLESHDILCRRGNQEEKFVRGWDFLSLKSLRHPFQEGKSMPPGESTTSFAGGETRRKKG